MKSQLLKIVNGKILTPGGTVSTGFILVKEGKIAEISGENADIPEAGVLDARGCYVAPGCIDFHVHGGGGRDFTEATPEAFYGVAEAHAQYGMTAMYATMAASPVEIFRQAFRACETVMDAPRNGARVMGLHLEGNYLNPVMKGGQFPECLFLPDPAEYKALLNETSCIKRWSASPELEGALAFGRYATAHGVLVSLAHTVADYPMVKTAFDAGYTHATHFYNAMTGVHKLREYKHEGTIESIYLVDDLTVELVGDGIHVPPAILKLVHKIKGVERTALVTDAMRAAAWEDAETLFNDPRVILEDGVGKLPDRSALSSSIATADRLIRTMVQQAGIPLADAVRMAAETPARIMGIADRKGTLEKGKDADIIFLSDALYNQATIVEGRVVYNALA